MRLARPHPAFVPAVTTALAFTVAVTTVPSLRFAYANVSLHVALETTEGLIAVVLAVLCAGRFSRTRALSDVLLATAFSGLALTNLVVSALPMIASKDRPEGFVIWLSLALRLAAAGALCAAGLATGTATHSRRWWSAAGGAVAVAALAAVAADAWLAEPIDPTLSPEASNRPVFEGHGVVIAALALSVLLHVVATVGFVLRAQRRSDPLLGWLAAGTAVGAIARVHYLLFPSLYSDWVYTGDLLRLGSYGLFLAGAIGELVGHWRATAELAAGRERGRLARELHDGLIQELSFIRSQTAGRAVLEPPMIEHVAAAAERGLAESRLALDALDHHDAPLSDALRAAVGPIARRAGATVAVTVVDEAPVDLQTRHALLRVAREAATNAVRHGRARTIAIELAREGGHLRMTAADDGIGFDADTAPAGFGLRSIRERVEALGGQFAIDAARGSGATLTVTVPAAGD